MNKIEDRWGEKGLLDTAKMSKVGNVGESEINGLAKFYLEAWI